MDGRMGEGRRRRRVVPLCNRTQAGQQDGADARTFLGIRRAGRHGGPIVPLDEQLAARFGCQVELLPEAGTTEPELVAACADAEIILHCYTPISAAVFTAALMLATVHP